MAGWDALLHKLRHHQLRDHAGLVAFGQKTRDGLAVDGAEIERPIVDVQPHELVGLGEIESAAVTQGVAQGVVAVVQAVLGGIPGHKSISVGCCCALPMLPCDGGPHGAEHP